MKVCIRDVKLHNEDFIFWNQFNSDGMKHSTLRSIVIEMRVIKYTVLIAKGFSRYGISSEHGSNLHQDIFVSAASAITSGIIPKLTTKDSNIMTKIVLISSIIPLSFLLKATILKRNDLYSKKEELNTLVF